MIEIDEEMEHLMLLFRDGTVSSIDLKNRMGFFKRAAPAVRFAHSHCL